MYLKLPKLSFMHIHTSQAYMYTTKPAALTNTNRFAPSDDTNATQVNGKAAQTPKSTVYETTFQLCFLKSFPGISV